MKEIIITLLLYTFITGCATTAPELQVVEVPVPVPCPKPPKVERPMIRSVTFTPPLEEEGIVSLTEKDIRNLLSMVSDLWGYVQQLEEIIKSYSSENGFHDGR